MKTFLEKNQNYHLVLLMPEETSNNEYLLKYMNNFMKYQKTDTRK